MLAGTLVHAVEALTRLSGHPPWSCCGLSTEAPSSDKTPIKQHLRDCAVQLLTGASNSKTWLDHLQLAAPSQVLLAPASLDTSVAHEIEPVTELSRADPAKAFEANVDAVCAAINIHASCSARNTGKGETHHTPALPIEMHRSPAAASDCAHNPDRSDVLAAAEATAAAASDELITTQTDHSPAVQRESEAAEQIVTQLLDNMAQLQDITLKAVHAAMCADAHMTTIQHASSAPNTASLTQGSRPANYSDSQDRKRHKPNQGLSRELKALQADACQSSNNNSCQPDHHATSSNASMSILRQQQVTGQFSLRRTLARQNDQPSKPRTQQKSRFCQTKSAPLSWAGPNADTSDIEALRRYIATLVHSFLLRALQCLS